MANLLPCPFCGGADVGLSDNEDKEWYANTWWVQCDCGARGPNQFDDRPPRTDDECKADAIAAWNQRANPDSTPG